MRKFLFFVLLSVFFLSGFEWAWNNDVYVHGYWRRNGTYVRPYYRFYPDGNVFNNWSTKGNINPYPGK